MQLSGAQILVQSLKAENVEYVFGYPGGAVLEIYDAIFQLKKFRHILVRHEQAAVHAADAYSRASNGEKIGVALVTSGPGATNAITGIATANSDSVPLVVISGQVGTPAIGSDAFQEVDTVGISRPCVKHNFLVTHISELAETVKKAFQLARTGRPGVVVIDVPKDVTQAMAKFSYPQEDINIRSYQPVTHGHTGQIKKAAQVMAAAKRPIVLFGGGVILGNASNVLTDFIQSTGTPCVSTLMGLGAFPSTNRQFLGMVGMHGCYEGNLALQNADVVLAVGARFDDRVISVPGKFTDDGKKIIHIDIDPSSIAKRVKADVPIVGDVKNVLADLLALWQKQNLAFNSNALERWWKTIENWRGHNSLWFDSTGESIKPQQVIQTLAKLTGNNALITSDVGQHQMFTAQYYPFQRPRQWLNSGGLGTMGVGLPYAMGAKLAKPEEDVFCITGEGSIQMNIQELSTCYQYRLPIKVINLNNGFLGMVRQWQELYYENRYSETYMESLPDFVKLAEAYGHIGIRVEKTADIEGALKEAIALKDRLVFMDFITDRTQNVYPMVGNGKGLDEMVLPPHMSEPQTAANNDREQNSRSAS
ncbi:biosynthetic-type acetolactate synthase large subunit [Snodgrassella gandavensis]|uniref:biosynthetic-type acetolactate synthase large subunit n=1 Tax=Snodgrassella gandavensis TaxID=2946698 RepID=UPI001EF69F63|nr:biosynthetic-type acetolactate synthase large subunit [Snodgrassella gandavensis]